jgi:sugar lactone lactonase YvrE
MADFKWTVATEEATTGFVGLYATDRTFTLAAGADYNLTPNPNRHGHTASSPALTSKYIFTANPARHGHTASSPTLTENVVLAPSNAKHTQTASSPVARHLSAWSDPVAGTTTTAAGLAPLLIAPPDGATADGELFTWQFQTDNVGATQTEFAFQRSAAPWDVSSLYRPAFWVRGQDTDPRGLFFKPDGLTMFMVGAQNDAVYQYTLSTAWDGSTASYASKSFSVLAQESYPNELFFAPDGLTMYVVGTVNAIVYQYTLGTAWDVSTASYANKSFSVAAQEGQPSSLFFKPDGLTMFVAGTDNNRVYQYTLSTAWDVSTASYANKSFSVALQDSVTSTLFFKPDGLSMFFVGFNDRVYQYTLSTAWDVSTASYASKSFSVATQDTSPNGLFFKPDGLTMFMLGGNAVYQYALSTAWDVPTASYASKLFSVATQETTPNGLFFKPDGLTMYVVGTVNDTVYQYTLGTAWDVSTASYASKSFSVASQELTSQDLFFKPDGLTMYIVGSTSDTVFQYTLSTAWDVSTASYASKSFSVALQDPSPTALSFAPDGLTMFMLGGFNDRVYQYTLSTAWDVSTASYASKSFSVASQETAPAGLSFAPDGLTMYVVGTVKAIVYQYTLWTAWDVLTAEYGVERAFPVPPETAPNALFFKPDGLSMFIVGSQTDRVYQYDVPQEWWDGSAWTDTETFITSTVESLVLPSGAWD